MKVQSKFSIGQCLLCGSKTNNDYIICRKCRFRIDYFIKYKKKKKYFLCKICGSEYGVKPFTGLCYEHHKLYMMKYKRDNHEKRIKFGIIKRRYKEEKNPYKYDKPRTGWRRTEW